MNESMKLAVVLFGKGTPRDSERSNEAEHALKFGLQQVLTVLAAVTAVLIAKNGSIPPGYSGRLRDALVKPTPGKLLSFLAWVCSAAEKSLPAEVSSQLCEFRKSSTWFPSMAQLRNLWAHPKDESPEQVLMKAVSLLDEIPPFLEDWTLALSNDNEVVCEIGDLTIGLEPFSVGWNASGPLLLTEIEPPATPVFSRGEKTTPAGFDSFWLDLRVRDPELDSPTAEEVREKFRRVAREYSGEAPWWLSEVPKPGPLGMLVEQGQLQGVLAHIKNDWPGVEPLWMRVDGGRAPSECLASCLELASPPRIQEILEWVTEPSPCVLAMNTGSLESRGLLQFLYFLADLQSGGGSDNLRILIERHAEALQKDQQKLWDRLPDDIDGLLRAPPRSARAQLADYLWTPSKPKKFLGLF